jgi:hypothetical protein
MNINGFEIPKLKTGTTSNNSNINLKNEEIKPVVYSDPELNDLMKLSGEELWLQDKFELLKEKSYGAFLMKYKEFFKKDYKG